MRTLPSSLRKQLEMSVLAARRAAEAASHAAIESLGVFADRRPEHLNSAQAALRNGLRAKWRQLGNDRDLLVAECAYEQWHRLLFARFLAENGLLLHPQFGAPVTLAECEELAADLDEPDAWSVAARFAAAILPGIFRLDDPCVRLRLAPEGRYALEQILDAIPAETFSADDALGWVYQFWQKDKKDEVNASERKVGGADLGPVTQLFTENYMVRFLLENSLGAWWAARHPDSQLAKGFEYLRFDDDKPAAGAFEGWPDRVAEVTVMDPCCGSGHFLVEAFSMLWQMRAEEEGLAPIEAQDAVLRDNLFGLELDPRCVQIAMFSVALQAWKAGSGWRQLPVPNIACSGIKVKAPIEEWKALALGDTRLETALVRLHILFRDADTLGSLIDPRRVTEISNPTGLQTSFEDAEWREVTPLLEAAASGEAADPGTGVLGAEITSISRAADLLTRRYTVIATNVPFLSRAKQAPSLRDHLERWYPAGMADLATAFVLRSLEMGSAVALVTPQSWHQQGSYTALREFLLRSFWYRCMARLGNNCWQNRVSNPLFKFHTVLSVICTDTSSGESIAAFDIGNGPVAEKAAQLKKAELIRLSQQDQLGNPDARLMMQTHSGDSLLAGYCVAATGVQTGDSFRYIRKFWELPETVRWLRMQSTALISTPFTGREHLLDWGDGRGDMSREPGARIQNTHLWGRYGVAVKQMGDLHATLYTGEAFDNNTAVLLPHHDSDLGAIWAFVSSHEYARRVREINARPGVTTADLAKVPFDIGRWREVAAQAGPLPKPWSDDPTQWLFEGRPDVSTAPLQVAVARLVGYRWLGRSESDDLDILADADGIVCLPAVAGEPPATDRVQQLLAAAFGKAWTPANVKDLLKQAGSKKSLADWLRDEFFKQHCSLFGNRPFIWHIWDGQRDGFSALVNYHRLDRKTLEKLTYTYLGQDWVERQRAEVRDGVAGAEARLAAALGLQKRLEAILEGEAPLDIYVRWKEIHEQPTGWEPDLNDGVRLNIRPFVGAGVLRSPFNIHWRKDRGKNPDGTERLNDVHVTLTEKIVARKRVGRA
jgi:MmeI, DNA-methyltransferase domain